MEGVGTLTLRVTEWIQAWLQSTLGEVREHKDEQRKLRKDGLDSDAVDLAAAPVRVRSRLLLMQHLARILIQNQAAVNR